MMKSTLYLFLLNKSNMIIKCYFIYTCELRFAVCYLSVKARDARLDVIHSIRFQK